MPAAAGDPAIDPVGAPLAGSETSCGREGARASTDGVYPPTPWRKAEGASWGRAQQRPPLCAAGPPPLHHFAQRRNGNHGKERERADNRAVEFAGFVGRGLTVQCHENYPSKSSLGAGSNSPCWSAKPVGPIFCTHGRRTIHPERPSNRRAANLHYVILPVLSRAC